MDSGEPPLTSETSLWASGYVERTRAMVTDDFQEQSELYMAWTEKLLQRVPREGTERANNGCGRGIYVEILPPPKHYAVTMKHFSPLR